MCFVRLRLFRSEKQGINEAAFTVTKFESNGSNIKPDGLPGNARYLVELFQGEQS